MTAHKTTSPPPAATRTVAAHVQAGISRSAPAGAGGPAQPKAAAIVRPLARHVSAAIQAKPAAAGGRLPAGAAHVRQATLPPRAALPALPAPPAGGRALPPARLAAAAQRPPSGRPPGAFQPKVAPARGVVQRMWLFNWLFPKEKVVEEEYQFHGAKKESHDLKVTDGPLQRGGRKIHVAVGAAYLDGEVMPQGEAWILTVASGRFPGGRGVSYLMIQRFAEVAKSYGATTVKLANSVNRTTVDALAQSGEDVRGERAALHVYSELGYNVDTAQTIDASSRTPQQLLTGTAAKTAGKWTNTEEDSAVLSTLIEQLIIENS